MADFLSIEPYVERRECKVSETYRWLMGHAMHALERLVIGRSAACLDAPALALLSQMPALRDWSGSEDREHNSKLDKLVPRWAALNDALFWHTITMARAALGPDDKPLVDEWDVAWRGHFWAFDKASFARTLTWVTSRDLPDDRAVALSRCFRTYIQNGRPPAWRRQMWRAVKGDAVVEPMLKRLMRPPPNKARESWRASERKWARHRRKRKENEARWKDDFVARVIANPGIIRTPGLPPGRMSWDQAHLLQRIEGEGLRMSRGSGGKWQALIPEFGQAVAEAFRDAALRQWRVYRPALRSEDGGSDTIPYALIFAMAGLEIEAGDDSRGLAALPPGEARYALRYAFSELNGFPQWLEPLYRAFPETGFAIIWGETRWELSKSQPDQPMHYVLHDLIYHAPWLHTDLAVPIHNWLTEHGAANHDVLRYGRTLMVSGGTAPEKLAALARRRVEVGHASDGQLPSWLALWVDTEPDAAILALAAKLGDLLQPDDARFAEQFVVALVGGRHEGGPVIGRWKTPAHLKTLYVLMHRHIRVAEDINRRNGKCYSPTGRDDAQDARSQLFSLLAEIPGESTYREILALAHDHPEQESRAYMRLRAHERAVVDSDRVWSLDDVLALGCGS